MCLPNSLERCTTIVGYDPYAFIMDRPSNLRIHKMRSPYDTGIDYFSKEPAPGSNEEKQNKIKKSKIVKFLKIGGIALAAVALFAGIKKLPGILKKVPGADNTDKEGFFKRAKNFIGDKLDSIKNHTKKHSAADKAENPDKEGFLKRAKNFMGSKIESVKNHFKKDKPVNDADGFIDIDDFLED